MSRTRRDISGSPAVADLLGDALVASASRAATLRISLDPSRPTALRAVCASSPARYQSRVRPVYTPTAPSRDAVVARVARDRHATSAAPRARAILESSASRRTAAIRGAMHPQNTGVHDAVAGKQVGRSSVVQASRASS